ncbi:MAG: protein kinase [Deltaproteobacteria bacterium]|nr:protein kinase [Deltaproteobacteria bacterium]
MADIFLGVRLDQRLLERFVAIKKIHNMNSGEQSDKFKMMFADEARIISTLSHPHIVQIFDFTEKGENFHIIMEYIDGENLGYILNILRRREDRVPLDIGIRLMTQALEALQYIHCATSLTGQPLNIVHRDLDPRNLMVDSNGYLKIIDFGVARTVVQTDMTAPDMFKGKLSHVAPEVFTESDIDLRADIYSLGLVLFEIATGQRPYRFEKSAALADTIQRIINEPLPSPQTLNPHIPDELAQIIQKACAKNRQKRYQSADELHLALTHFANHPEYGCGIATNGRIKEWFNDQFQERLTRRRNFESNALMKARQSLASNDQSTDSVPPMTPRERLQFGSIAPTSGDTDCQVTGLESLSGASFATGLMDRTANGSSAVRTQSGILSSAGIGPKSASGQPLMAPPASVGSFPTTPPPPLDAQDRDEESHRFAGGATSGYVKIAVFAGAIAVAAAAVLIFALGRNSTIAATSTDHDRGTVSDKMLTSNDAILITAADSADATNGATDTILVNANADNDANKPSTNSKIRNSRSVNPNGTATRSWTKHKQTERQQVAATSKPSSDTGKSIDPKYSLSEQSLTEHDRDQLSEPESSPLGATGATAVLSSSMSPQNSPAELEDTRPEQSTQHRAVPGPAKSEKTASSQYISVSGDWSGAKVAQSGCGSCHSVDATSKTSSQWEYFFSHNRHRRHANFKTLFSQTELRRVESYLLSIVEKSKTNNSGIAGIR